MRPIRRWATAVVAGALVLTAAGTASAATVYNNIPSPLAGNYDSLGFEANAVAEFGGLVELAAGARNNPVLTATLSSWGCQSGGDATCLTAPGSVFSLPITVNVYAANPDNSVGDLLATDTQSFRIPFRPSADPANCGTGTSAWYDAADNHCYNGFAHNISWDLGGRNVTLPDRVIVSVMYNTSHHGYQPIGSCATSANCGYDSLNLALMSGAPLIGSDPLFDGAYIAYEGGGTAQNVFALDRPGWTDLQPAIRIDTFPLQTGPSGPAGPAGSNGSNGANGSSCTVTDNGDGSKTISCSDGTTATVSDGTNAATPAVTVARPNTKIVRAKIRALKRAASFSFKGSGGKGKLSFQCKLDGQNYKSCRSAKSYKNLKPGKHVFRVRAKDAKGKLDLTPATKRFKI